MASTLISLCSPSHSVSLTASRPITLLHAASAVCLIAVKGARLLCLSCLRFLIERACVRERRNKAEREHNEDGSKETAPTAIDSFLLIATPLSESSSFNLLNSNDKLNRAQ